MSVFTIDSELFLSRATCYLESKSLAHYEVVCREARSQVLSRAVWLDNFRQALPCFEIGGCVLENIARPKSAGERRQAKHALGSLSKLGLCRAAPMPLTNVVVANRLGTALRSAFSAADAHLNIGGGLAVASALCFRFPDAEKVASAPQILGHWEAHKGGEMKPEDWIVSDPGWVRVPTTTVVQGRAGDMKIRSSFFDIQVRLAYLNATTLVSALACGPDNFIESEVAFDLSCLEPDFLLHTRDMPILLNGEWREVKGLRSHAPNPKQLSTAMASGLTCVLNFRDIGHESRRKVTARLSSLNLESLISRPQS